MDLGMIIYPSEVPTGLLFDFIPLLTFFPSDPLDFICCNSLLLLLPSLGFVHNSSCSHFTVVVVMVVLRCRKTIKRHQL